MPAGAYTIRTMPNTPLVLLFENEATRTQAMVFVRSAAAAPGKPVLPLTFSDSGERMELTSIATGESTYELNAHPAGKASKGVVLTLTSSGK
jgi:hypothetical protein